MRPPRSLGDGSSCFLLFFFPIDVIREQISSFMREQARKMEMMLND
jgi:hypothetical protein